jgi:hypothetical protein
MDNLTGSVFQISHEKGKISVIPGRYFMAIKYTNWTDLVKIKSKIKLVMKILSKQ